ncbi:hypothetical protein PR202_gb12184 [Eleusine coracana subsp. coracana]|uniref:Protein kinase domain-containing protein n=1 Tax=Eleusine coracana subsp. coracana TaxID=191504 RepID=A0AAV5EPE2_ELECO|nr:hypothetical protein PR202_gb12184 [Eleusine coracana subsp. coracana]
MGLVNDRNNGNASNHILAVEINTVQNNEFGDINSNHVGININGVHSMNSSSAGYYDDKTGNFYNLTLMSSEVMRVWVHYDEESMKLGVTLAPVRMAKPAMPMVSATCNLSQVLSKVSFIGFSSATGMVNTRHYILGWSFGMNASAPPIDTAKLPRLPRVGPKDDSRFLEIILPLATVSFLLTVSMVAFLLVRRHLSGSLDKYLYGCDDPDLRVTLNWTQRFQIIRGIVSSLHYLHEECEKVIIHRDVKASNVLLDNEMNGRLGDFGLARLYDHGVDPQTTNVLLDNEMNVARTGKATPLTDVYAFGVFMLEVTCGRRPLKQSTEDNQLMLLDWVLDHWQKGLLTDTMDVRLQGDYDINEACLVLKLGLLCSHPYRNSRPNMRQVLEYLSGDKPLPELSSTNLSFHVMSMMQNEGFDDYIMYKCQNSV